MDTPNNVTFQHGFRSELIYQIHTSFATDIITNLVDGKQTNQAVMDCSNVFDTFQNKTLSNQFG